MAKKNKKDQDIEKERVRAEEVKESNTPSKIDNNMSTILIMGVIGLVLLLLPEETNTIIGYIIGGALLAACGITITNYNKSENKKSQVSLIGGILYGLFGVIIILKPLSVMKLATAIFGIYLIVNGALKVHSAWFIKNNSETTWRGLFVVGTIITVFGVILIINPFSGLIITKIAGAFLLISAIVDIVTQFVLNKK